MTAKLKLDASVLVLVFPFSPMDVVCTGRVCNPGAGLLLKPKSGTDSVLLVFQYTCCDMLVLFLGLERAMQQKCLTLVVT